MSETESRRTSMHASSEPTMKRNPRQDPGTRFAAADSAPRSPGTRREFLLASRRRAGRHRPGRAARRRRIAGRRFGRAGRPASPAESQAGRPAVHGRRGQPPRPVRLQAGTGQAPRPAVGLRRAGRGIPGRARALDEVALQVPALRPDRQAAQRRRRRLGDVVDDIAFVHNMVGKTGVHSPAT